MRAQRIFCRVTISALALVLISASAGAQPAGTQPAGMPMVYVGKFKPVESSPTGIGPLHALNSGMHQVKAENKAAQLSSALVEALRARKVSAEPLPEDAGKRPHSGWLVQGVYYALDQNSRLISGPLSPKQDNVQVSLTVADLAGDPSVPFAVIGTDAVMKGQGAPVGWNPYVVAAKFVVHQVEGQDSTSALADQIAQKIIDQQQVLLAHDPMPPAGN